MVALSCGIFSSFSIIVKIACVVKLCEIVDSIRYMTKVLFQLTLWQMLYVFPVTSLLNVFVCFMCLQHKVPALS